MEMVAPRTPSHSKPCCLCRLAHTRTVLLGVWYLITNALVLLILLSTLADPDHYYFSGSALGGVFEFMNDAKMWITIAVSLLLFLVGTMATYGAYKQHAVWIIPFFCYQIFDFALITFAVFTMVVYPYSTPEFIRQLPPNFPYRDDIMSMEPPYLDIIIFLFVIVILLIKLCLINSVWNCYHYINGRNSSDVLVYAISNDTMESWANPGGAGS
ncbi:lysosomal-associated transmembrane protein 4B isoform X1 [Talpa occidentalis]|uniref:lysosomal-associated transmembrane protein 4B isoform X1 n=1 Tax=Talpa occidentalis TaxID=50954 RepID=UPI0023F92541|nr:lysosomal-associated transmembrane protein 4B isoform X1 [Talpa occidentalis]